MTSKDFIAFFKKTYQNRTSSFLSGLMLMISDALALFCCIGFAFFIMNLIKPSAINFRSFVFYSYYFPLILTVYYASGIYPGIMISPADEIRKIFLSTTGCYIGICLSIILQERSDILAITTFISRDTTNKGVVFSFLFALPITVIVVPAMREIVRHLLGKTQFWGVPAVIYSTNNSADEVIKRLTTRKSLGYNPAIIIDSKATDCSMKYNVPVFSDTPEIFEIIKKLKIKVAIVCDYKGDYRRIINTYRYTINVSKNQYLSSNLQLRDLGGILGFSTTHNLTKRFNLFIKRLIDLALIILFLPILLPVMILLAFLVKITSPGPVFYGHKRVGKDGKEIKCWKFRSMYKNSQEMLEEILKTDPERKAQWEAERKFIDDPRITKFGKFLRKTSLDELPQLINILLGNMSFVGPRPVTKDELEKYADSTPYFLSVTPGLSGMWQISGRSDTGYEERINLDTFYIQNWSIWLDLWIIIKTIGVVLNGKGAY